MTDVFGAVSPFARPAVIRRDGGEKPARVFIQPVSVTAPEREGLPTPAGLADERRYLIIAGPGAFELEGAGPVTVECAGRLFRLLRFEEMGGGSHCEGVLKECMAGGRDA